MIDQETIDTYRSNGFVNAGPALNDDEVEELRDELERVMRDRDREDITQPVLLRNLNSKDPEHPVWQIVDIWEASEAYKRLIENPIVTDAAARLSGAKELRVWHDQIQYKPAAAGGTNHWHQDSPKWGNIAPKTSQISAWIALDDVDAENGCMSMVPGSHRWGDQDKHLATLDVSRSFLDLPATDPEGNKVETKLCPVRKGHVHFHHGLTWHGSHANTSDRPRRAIAIHFMTEETRYVASGKHVMKPYVEVADGARLEGTHFPLVWSAAQSAPVA